MPRRTLDPVSTGNPARLTRRQHIFPRKSIARFVRASGRVQVHLKDRGIQFPAKPDDVIFTADRRWDQRAETGFMRGIEDRFQALADDILAGRVRSLNAESRDIVHRFYALWGLRADFADTAPRSLVMVGVTGEDLSEAEFDAIEARGGSALRPNGIIPDRSFNGLSIQMRIDRITEEASDLGWGIARSLDGQLVVPDRPHAMVVPLDPVTVLLGGYPDLWLAPSDTRLLNRAAVENSARFYFARSLSDCPLS